MPSTGQLLQDSIKWAKEAGRIQMEYFRGDRLDIRSKLNDSDIVTAADKASEDAIVAEIRKNIRSIPFCRKSRAATKTLVIIVGW